MDIRQRLLHAAALVYAEMGFRGATTRRIAQHAGVNEITLFRHFGSKHALIHEALHSATLDEVLPSLPDTPARPEAELAEWAVRFAEHLARNRSMIRTCMGELEEHPENGSCVTRSPVVAHDMLAAYLRRLRAHGFAAHDVDSSTAASMLMGALFCIAVSGDLVPELYPRPLDQTARTYVRYFVRSIAPALPAAATRGRARERGAGRAANGEGEAAARDVRAASTGARGKRGRSRTARGNGHAPSRNGRKTRDAGSAPARRSTRPSRPA
ncbi:MAG TPA: TetR/AcrR family transcriptional regulator [Gemmatimonadaceae bacterium]|nr:TetR/AcrR family transcriptional regulator [Gemmatimonadaceae bacterium]